jgi:alpha-beta hydrolase superfamily lysophospholipase
MATPSAAAGGSLPASLEEGFIAARDNLRLYWRSFSPPEPRAHVAIVHGYCEHSGRYREAMERLARAGLAAHAFDYRGHGQSDGRRAHVDRFSDYLDDLDGFLAHVRARADGKPVVLLGHSLGGLICARWAQERAAGVQALALSSPFLGMAFSPRWLEVKFAGLAEWAIPWLPVPSPLKIEQLTHDPEIQRVTAQDPLYQRHTTPRWFKEAMAAQSEAFARAGTLALPCLVMGGSDDPIASPEAIRRFHDRIAAAPKAYRSYPGMLHEILNELDRDRVYVDLLAWIDERIAG